MTTCLIFSSVPLVAKSQEYLHTDDKDSEQTDLMCSLI